MPLHHSIAIAKTLWRIIEPGNCVAWIGSGMSRPAEYPDWKDTIRTLCSECNVPNLGTEESEMPQKLMDKADECKRENPEAYKSCLARLFGGTSVGTRSAYSLLMRIPFKGYVTTNFDPLLSTAGYTQDDTELYAYPDLPVDRLHGESKPIYYIHGLANATGENLDLVLSTSEFQEAYEGGMVRSFLDQLLVYHDIVFIGCSLGEPNIRETFSRVNSIRLQILGKGYHPELPRMVALSPSYAPFLDAGYGVDSAELEASRSVVESSETQRLKELGIEVIRYDVTSRSHEALEEILGQVCSFHTGRPFPPVPMVSFDRRNLP